MTLILYGHAPWWQLQFIVVNNKLTLSDIAQ